MSQAKKAAEKRLDTYQDVLRNGGKLPYGDDLWNIPGKGIATGEQYWRWVNRQERYGDRHGGAFNS